MVKSNTIVLVWAVARDGRIYGVSAPSRPKCRYNTHPTSVRLSDDRRLLIIKAGAELLPLPVATTIEVYYTRDENGREKLSYINVSAYHSGILVTIRMKDERRGRWLLANEQ